MVFLSPGGRGLPASGGAEGDQGLGGNDFMVTPTLILPHQGGGNYFGIWCPAAELGANSLQCPESGAVEGHTLPPARL